MSVERDPYLLLKGQMEVPAHWRDTLQSALDAVDLVGSIYPQWSRFDQPEYPGGAR